MKLSKIEQAIKSIEADIHVLVMAKSRLIDEQNAKPTRPRKPKAAASQTRQE